MSLQHKLGQKARRACCWLLSPPGVSCYENGSITSSFGQSCTRASPHNRRCSNHRPPIWSPPLAAARSQAARAPLGAGLKQNNYHSAPCYLAVTSERGGHIYGVSYDEKMSRGEMAGRVVAVCSEPWSAQDITANTKYSYTICKTSAQRRRRWADVVHMLYK